MKDPFSKNKNAKVKRFDVNMERGDFGDMMKTRKKQLPEIEKTITDALKDYSGENITIIIQKEDENGLPDHCTVVMAGVSRMESQVAMAKALEKCRDTAMELLMEGAKGDVKAMLAIATTLVGMIDKEEE